MELFYLSYKDLSNSTVEFLYGGSPEAVSVEPGGSLQALQ